MSEHITIHDKVIHCYGFLENINPEVADAGSSYWQDGDAILNDFVLASSSVIDNSRCMWRSNSL